MKNLLFSLSIISLLSLSAFAQNGKISGQVVDGKTGEELIGAAVLINGTTTGSVTDLSGNYTINIAPGTYTLNVSYVSYTSQIIENVQVVAGEVTNIDVSLSSDIELEEVVIEAEAIQDNDIALLKLQKKALAVQDGISSKEIKRMGASNAAESMQQVTGATIEDGKYMVMRGLGDRYSITQLNGVTLPSADPYRSSTSMDMIPADMLENIVTVKTFTPDQPGNFTGGKVDISTKSIPDQFYMTFGLSAGYNSQSSFINDFQRDGTRGGLDWFGYEDGTRSRPEELDTYNDYIRLGSAGQSALLGKREENTEEREAIDQTSSSLDNAFVPEKISTPLNYGIDFSFGDQYNLFGKPLGLNIGMAYDKNYSYVGNGLSGLFTDVGSEEVLQVEQDYDFIKSVEEAQIGGLASLSFQVSPNNELTWNTIYSHLGEIGTDNTSGFWRETGTQSFTSQVTAFTERSLINHQLLGSHFLGGFGTRINWMAGTTKTRQDEPDLRMFGYTNDTNSEGDVNWGMNRSIVGILPSHFFRELADTQYNAKIDIDQSIGKNNSIKVGFDYSEKNRTFSEYIYSFNATDRKSYNHPDYVTFSEANGDLNAFFASDNKAVMGTFQQGTSTVYGFGNIYSDQTQVKNSYTGHENIWGAYLMGVFQFGDLRSILGIRAENTDLLAESEDETQVIGEVKKLDWLPSVNLIYAVNENSNVRLAASQTLARPNMREIAPFASVGGVGKDIVLGNPELSRTLVRNLDLRYEVYPKPGELFAVSAYYKLFIDPIIWQLTPKASTPELKPVNSENAQVGGLEIEFRKKLGFISAILQNFSFTANGSLIYSRVDKGLEELELLRREQEQGRRLYIKDWRPFQGQSPYIINLFLSHYSEKLDWENSLTYNTWGDRLSYVTDAVNPDVFETARHSLNFVSRKQFGDHFSMTITLKNLLDMNYRQVYDFPSDEEFLFESYRMGRSFKIGLNYRL
jgi:hypothetical protein